MNNDAILASISKIHAYRYAKEKQRGALTTNGGFSTTDPALLQVPCTIQCVFSLDELSDTDHTIFSTVLDNKGAKVNYRSDRKRLAITLEENFYSIENISLGHIYNIVFTSDSNISKVYVDGAEVLSTDKPLTNTRYLIGWNFYNVYGNCNYLLHRHFNYAMSADEVKTLDNNGDPLGYVVPKTMKSGDNKCIAEYVAPNLVSSSTDKTIATTWLDSAKQLPWSDAYLPPLLQSKGGYDMVANGAPEVLFKGQEVEIQSIANNTNGGVSYPGKFSTLGFCQSWIYPLIKGATYRLNYKGSVTKDIGSIYLCSLCKLEGDYVTMPREDVAEKIFSWNNTDSINQGGEFKVPLETDKDCIVITGLRDTYDPNIIVKLVKIE